MKFIIKKTIEKLNQIFVDIESNTKEYLQDQNWNRNIFKPRNRVEIIRQYYFRLYGKMSGSLFKVYNDNNQLCAYIYYLLNVKTNQLTREVKVRELSKNVLCHIDIPKIITNI